MTETYRVLVTKDYLVFSSAHFITFNQHVCERLHGHNYRVRAEVEGPLDENHYVVDFIALRDFLQQLVLELDHRVLLPTEHRQIHVERQGTEVVARFESRRWVFPAEDCVLLPVANTTTEQLAAYLGRQLLAQWPDPHFHALEIGVDENHGQWGYWRKTLGGSPSA